MRVLLTGATGFIGSAIADSLIDEGHHLAAIVRKKSDLLSKEIEQFVGDLADLDSFPSELFSKIDCVIHSAARAHITTKNSTDFLNEYRKINRDLTLNLAKIASINGVKRFVYLSSVKVNGDKTNVEVPFTPNDGFLTDDPYGISKYEAEQGLLELAAVSGMEVVILRPPLVYGPKVKANFALMIYWVKKGVPLPFGAIDNKRSLIALDNLVNFVLLCADRFESPKAANQIFLLSDGADVSTTTLLKKVAIAYGVRSRLFSVPTFPMRIAAKLLGIGALAERLCGNLQVDSDKAKNLLGWQPICSMDEQLKKMADLDSHGDN